MDEKTDAAKTALEALSKEEILQKYKGLLNIAKKAKQAKDELANENRTLKEALSRSVTQKEADKNALLTMQEMLEQFTEQKLTMTSQLNELQQMHKAQAEMISKGDITNESLQRQLQRVTDENETLLQDIERMDDQLLLQVNALGKEQRQHLAVLEKEMHKLKEAECQNASLVSKNQVLIHQQQASDAAFRELKEKYEFVKQVNSDQRHKFNALKDRFIDVQSNLKKLQICKKVLLETQHEYADAISSWQCEIINASQLLCEQMNSLKVENVELKKLVDQKERNLLEQRDTSNKIDVIEHLLELQRICEIVSKEEEQKDQILYRLTEENKKLQIIKSSDNEAQLKIEYLTQELREVRAELSNKVEELNILIEEKYQLKAAIHEREMELEPEDHELLLRLTEMEKVCAEKCFENSKLRSALEETHDALEKIEQENIVLLDQIQNQPSNQTEAIDTSLKIDEEEVDEDLQHDDSDELQARNVLLIARLQEMEHKQSEMVSELKELRVLKDDEASNVELSKTLQEERENLLNAVKKEIEFLKVKYEEEERIIIKQQKRQIHLNETLQTENKKLADHLKQIEKDKLDLLKTIQNADQEILAIKNEKSYLVTILKKEKEELVKTLSSAIEAKNVNIAVEKEQKELIDSMQLNNEHLEMQLEELKQGKLDREAELINQLKEKESAVQTQREEQTEIVNKKDILIKELKSEQENVRKQRMAERQNMNNELSNNLVKAEEQIKQLINERKEYENSKIVIETEKMQLIEEFKKDLLEKSKIWEEQKKEHLEKEHKLIEKLENARVELENMKEVQDTLKRENIESAEKLLQQLENATKEMKQMQIESENTKNVLENEHLQNIEILRKEKQSAYEKIEEMQNSFKLLVNERKAYVEEIKPHSEDVDRQLEVELQNQKKELVEKLHQNNEIIAAEKQEQKMLHAEIKSLNEKLQQDTMDKIQQQHAADCFQHIEAEHQDVLAEMRELNEALKTRGDVISRQQEKQQELIAELKRNNIKLEELEQLVNNLKSEIIQKDLEIQQLKTNVEMQETHSEMSNISHMEELQRLREADESFEDKYNKLRQVAVKLKKKQQEQNEHIENLNKEVNSLKAYNQKLKSKGKQTNMLNLEIEAAEKTLKEHAAKLMLKMEELQHTKAELELSKNNIKQLKMEMNLLEQEKNAECEHANELKQQIDLLQAKCKATIHEQQSVLLLKENLEVKLQEQTEHLQQHNLQYLQQQEKQQQDFIVLQEKCKQQEAELAQHLIQLQQATQRCSTQEQQLSQLKMEYDGYKHKAQTVLRKQQNENNKVNLPELEASLESMQYSQQLLEMQLQQKQQECEALESKLEAMSEEHMELQEEHKNLKNQFQATKQKNSVLIQQQQQQLHQQQEALQQQRLHMQHLKENYEEQLKELLVQQKKETEKKFLIDSEQSKINLLLMEREAAEGSEEADLATLSANRKLSTVRPIPHDFMPLDELLNAPVNAMNDTYRNMDELEQNKEQLLSETLQRLEDKERQCKHLTTLLTENEQDLAKLTQMNDILKEELRRQERSVERQEHMHNSEYLKNIVLKFLTLNNNDERTRLVPVLNTILKLSRSEMEILNNVAKGQRVSGNSGWSFLPWGGGTN